MYMNNFDPRQDQMELHAMVWGHVQGIGFRVTARHYALQLGLKGTACNLDDGNVEIYAQGTREKLEEFIKHLKGHFGPGYIARMDIKFEKPSTTYDRFQII